MPPIDPARETLASRPCIVRRGGRESGQPFVPWANTMTMPPPAFLARRHRAP